MKVLCALLGPSIECVFLTVFCLCAGAAIDAQYHDGRGGQTVRVYVSHLYSHLGSKL